MGSKKALLTGINNYKFVSDLRGCISDVQKFESLLTEVFEFSKQNIRSLVDENVVKSKIKKEWEWLLRGAKPGDQLVFMYAGHGSQTADLNGDEPDGVDELLCLYDMDFDDPDSYLLDDEINEFTRRLPDGVSLTIIFDSCHSGTATRMMLPPGAPRAIAPHKTPLVDLEATFHRMSARGASRSLSLDTEGHETIKRLLTPHTEQDARNVVLARYIQPPPKILELMHRRGTRRGFSKSRSNEKQPMNHVFFAGSQDRQTSADAFIDGNPHGAFSFHFCKAVRNAGSGVDQQALLKEVRESLAHASFDQVPQLEPESTQGPLFGSPQKTSATPSKTKPSKVESELEILDTPVGHKMLELLHQILNELKGGRAAVSVPSGNRALVYVHGICKHEAGYSQGWWESLRNHLSSDLRGQLERNRPEVLWSHLVTSDRTLSRDVFSAESVRAYEKREEELAQFLRDVVEDRAHRELVQDLPAQDRDLTPREAQVAIDRGILEATGLSCIDDFAKYLLQDSIRREVKKQFFNVVLPLLEGGVMVDVMSHSWGSVIAYEALREIDNRQLTGQVLNLFTIGSALSIVPIQRMLKTPNFERPRHVRRWINLDAKRDVVGGSLNSLGYRVDAEFLNLEPVGCRLFSTNPWCPHESYFHTQNVAVNRDIFARFMAG